MEDELLLDWSEGRHISFVSVYTEITIIAAAVKIFSSQQPNEQRKTLTSGVSSAKHPPA
jgi:hypothetical protein